MKKFIIFLLVATFFVPSLILAEASSEATSSPSTIQAPTENNANVKPEPMLIREPRPAVKPEPRSERATSTAVLEKISSPEQIKNFKNIKKEGNTLFGIRIQQLETKIQGLGDKLKEALNKPLVRTASSTNPTPDTSASSTKGLEKIAHPNDLALFEKIKQVGSALWGYRKVTKENLGASVLTTETVTCLKTAIDKKDTAVKDSLSSASESLIKATSDRNTCQKTALDLTNNSEIMQGFKVCKDSFNSSIKESRTSSRKFRDAAWKTYQQEVRACYKTDAMATSTEIKSEGANVLLDDGGNNLEL